MYLNYNVDTENMPKQGNDQLNSAISLSKQITINQALANRMPQQPQGAMPQQPQAPKVNEGWGRTNN